MLSLDGSQTPGRLAERIGITRGGAVTAMIDRLERAGFVRRRRDTGDRRRVLVELDSAVAGDAITDVRRPRNRGCRISRRLHGRGTPDAAALYVRCQHARVAGHGEATTGSTGIRPADRWRDCRLACRATRNRAPPAGNVGDHRARSADGGRTRVQRSCHRRRQRRHCHVG
ncbi:MAG TPA: MarR family transcriptional regulator [Aldersonia sp.]